LAQCALSKIYGQKTVYSGPAYEKMEIRGNSIHLYFTNADGGLIIQHSDTLKGFAIAGNDKQFVWADAKIKGHKVIVSSENVIDPVAVRYNWAHNPIGNLYNGKGLPAMPFRTDD
jgi:sialate O-acetylesterase